MSITSDRIRAYTACPTAPADDPILVAWMTAYAEWEDGLALSPSAQDLLDIAHGIDDAICETQHNADILFDLLCDGWELPDAAAYVRTFVTYV